MRHTSKLSQAAPAYVLRKVVHPSILARLEMHLLPPPERTEADDVLTLTYRSPSGWIQFLSDGIRIVIEAYLNQKLMLRCAMRDRQLDATQQGSPLTAFPNSDPACNRLPADGFRAAELSIYSYDPDSYLDNIGTPGTLGNFISDPDSYIWSSSFDAPVFFQLWEASFFSGRAPWQKAMPMPDVSRFFVNEAADLLKQLGYHRVDSVPSWFNVARFFEKLGYQFTYGEHKGAYECMSSALDHSFSSLTVAQRSWLVALQNIPERLLPAELRLPARWPVTHTNMYWVRMHRDLNDFLVPLPIDSGFCSRIVASNMTML